MCKAIIGMESPHLRSDLIIWNESLDSLELLRDFRIGEYIDTSIQNSVIFIIKSNWNSFREQGLSRPVLDFEFYINKVNTTPVC